MTEAQFIKTILIPSAAAILFFDDRNTSNFGFGFGFGF